jgi:hypothetical protein
VGPGPGSGKPRAGHGAGRGRHPRGGVDRPSRPGSPGRWSRRGNPARPGGRREGPRERAGVWRRVGGRHGEPGPHRPSWWTERRRRGRRAKPVEAWTEDRDGGLEVRRTERFGGPAGGWTGSRDGLASGRKLEGSAARRSRPGASRLGTHPPRRASALFRERAGPVTAVRVLSSGRGSGGRTMGSRGRKPPGCEWPRHATGFGEEQAVKVVGNGGGGTKRVWKPATRRAEPSGVRAPGGAGRREVDSPSWERRRGGEPHGRRFEGTGTRSRAGRGTRTDEEDEVLEGERKVRSAVQAGRETDQLAARWKTPGSRAARRKGRRRVPGSRTTGYTGPSSAEDTSNAVEGRTGRNPGRSCRG